MRLEVVALEKLDRVRSDQWQTQFLGEIDRRIDQCLLLRLTARMNTLQFEVKGTGEQAFPYTGTIGRLLDVPELQGLGHVALPRTGQGNQPVATDFAQHLAGDFSPAARTRGEV